MASHPSKVIAVDGQAEDLDAVGKCWLMAVG